MRRLLLIAMLSLPLPAMAQDTAAPDAAQQEESNRDRSYFTRLIEDNLSSKGRTIQLDGFRGALSSRATFDQLTIADDQGVWLTVRNGAMSWSRAAVLTGRIEIRELSAAEIDLARLPAAAPEDEAASPEATPFSLPELPLSVNIGTLKVDKLALGAPVLGEDLAFDLNGALSLAGGEGKADIRVNRIDGPKGTFSFTGDFANATRQLTLDLLVDEAQDGIVSKKIGLPGTPPLTLAVAGSGPLDNFSSDIVLSTDGQPRLSGKVILGTRPAAEGAPAGTAPDSTFDAQLAGDVTPMLPEEYRAFFGTNVHFIATGARSAAGVTDLTRLSVAADAFTLDGSVRVAASGLPEKFDLTSKIGLASGEPVLLPASGEQTWITSGDIVLGYDAATSNRWTLDGVLNQIARPDMRFAAVRLNGAGTIAQDAQAPAVNGRVRFDVQGIGFDDAALAEAVGPTLSGSTGFGWTQGGALNFTGLDLTGRDLTLAGDLSFDNLSEGIDLTAALDLNATNLAHYAPISGQPLSGAIAGHVDGKATLLSGAFDVVAKLTGQDLKIGQEQADNILAGTAQIDASVLRDERGLTIRSLTANARTLSAEASGLLATGTSDLSAKIAISDMSVLGNGYRGTANLTATLKDENGERVYTANGTAANVAIGNDTANRLLAGNSVLSVTAAERDGTIRLRNLSVQNPQVQVTAQGAQDQAAGHRLTVSARLANAALLAPNFPGPVTVEGTVNETGANYAVDLRGTGPGGTQATVSGTVATNFSTTNLAIAGRTETALANAFIAPQSIEGPLTFDLRMNGAPGLAALSGRIATQNAQMVLPSAAIALQAINLRADLAQGRATLSGGMALRNGGTISVAGPITLSGDYPADLRVTLNGARFRDPQLYDTRVSGGLTVAGPLTGGAAIRGALTLTETEIRVPSGGLGGTAEIPEITHRNEGAASRTTRARAGLLGETEASGGGGNGYRLDITVNAPREIYVRGRGLDAELGGSIRLTGTTNNIVPIGHFSLIRGRLDILAKRFNLTEGNVAMQGAMIPWISFTATTNQDDVAISLKLEGEATEPTLSITSSPELPEEEVLARLLFNKGLTNLSALQAAQLASSVATLAGKGGTGIMSRLRQGFGLDDLDVGTDAEGNATVKAGKYLSNNVYTDVAIDGTGETTLNLNLDVTSNITARGSVGSEGDSGLGLFFEKDY